MIKKLENNSFLNTIMAAIIGAFLMYLSMSMGFAVSLVQMVPFITLAINNGYKYSVLGLLASFLLSLIYMDPLVSLMKIVPMSLYVIFIVYMIDKRKKLKEIVVRSTIIRVFVYFGAALVFYLLTKENPIDLARQTLYTMAESMTDILSKDINFPTEDVKVFEKLLRETIDLSIMILPALVFISSLIMNGINILISISILNNVDDRLRYDIKLNTYRPSENFKIGIVTVSLAVAGLYLIKFSQIELLAMNVFAVIGFILTLNGIAVLDALYEKRINKFFRLLMPILFLFVLRMYSIYALIGGVDLFFDFRKRGTRNDRQT